MADSKILDRLRARFEPDPPQFYDRRIIFWNDEDSDYEAEAEAFEIGEFSINDVQFIRLTGNNNFEVKKRLLYDDPQGDYLIYNPLPDPHPNTDVFYDLKAYNEEFRADFVSEILSSYDLPDTPEVRKIIHGSSAFFKNKKRREFFAKIRHPYKSENVLKLDLVCAAVNMNSSSFEDLVIQFLNDFVNENKSRWLLIEKYRLDESVKALIQLRTGFVLTSWENLPDLADHLLLNAFAINVDDQIGKSVENLTYAKNMTSIPIIVEKWIAQSHEQFKEMMEYSDQKHGMRNRFSKAEPSVLASVDIYASADEELLKSLSKSVLKDSSVADDVLSILKSRKTYFWFDEYEPFYEALGYAAEMQAFYKKHLDTLNVSEKYSSSELWKLYTDELFKMDQYYRKFHKILQENIANKHEELSESLKELGEEIENLYQDWYLKNLGILWSESVDEDLAEYGYVQGIPRQRKFVSDFVYPVIKDNKRDVTNHVKPTKKFRRIFVLVSDAFRYETAEELRNIVGLDNRGEAVLKSMQAEFPSVTKFGMASLLPVYNITLNNDLDVLMNGFPTNNKDARLAVLQRKYPDSYADRLSDFMKLKRNEKLEKIRGKEIIYLYQNLIDKEGEDGVTESRTFIACADVIKQLADAVHYLAGTSMATDIIVTADHGFIYTGRALHDFEKLGSDILKGPVLEKKKRYAIGTSETTSDVLMAVNMSNNFENTDLKGFSPKDYSRIKAAGGDPHFVHGGISLQEMTVPVIIYKNKRAGGSGVIETVNAEVHPIGLRSKYTNTIIDFKFVQQEPVSDSVRSCEYQVSIEDTDHKRVSDTKIIKADRKDVDSADREFTVYLTLSQRDFKKKDTYYLTVRTSEGLFEDFPIHIDISCVIDDEFNFQEDW